MNNEERTKISRKIRQEVASWIIMMAMVLFGFVQLVTVIHGIWISEDKWVLKAAKEHFAAVVGLPGVAVASLFVVSIFEFTAGPIEFEGLGFKFKGASGPIVLWAICFLVISGCVKLLW